VPVKAPALGELGAITSWLSSAAALGSGSLPALLGPAVFLVVPAASENGSLRTA